MNEHVDKILKGAASNVACESEEEISKETLENIKKQILGQSNKTDESFIYGLYQSVVEDNEMKKASKSYVKK